MGDKVWGAETKKEGRAAGREEGSKCWLWRSLADAQGMDRQRSGAGGRASCGIHWALTHLRPLTGQLRKCLDGVSIIIYFSWPSPFLKANEGKMRNVQGKKYFDWCHTDRRGWVSGPQSLPGRGCSQAGATWGRTGHTCFCSCHFFVNPGTEEAAVTATGPREQGLCKARLQLEGPSLGPHSPRECWAPVTGDLRMCAGSRFSKHCSPSSSAVAPSFPAAGCASLTAS